MRPFARDRLARRHPRARRPPAGWPGPLPGLLLGLLLVLPGAARAQALLEYRYQYDAIGQPTAVTDGAGHTDRNAWDALGRLQSQTNPLNHSTTYRYQANDALTRVQAPNGAVTAWTVDGFGQAADETGPDRGLTRYQYDAAGNLTQRTDARGARVDTTYDALNRPIARRVYRPDHTLEVTHLYAWDRPPRGIGRLDEIDVGPNRLAFDYDLAGHVTARAYIRGAVALTVHTAYDATTGQRDTLTYPSGSVIQYRYDVAGRVAALTWDGQPVADQLQYTASGALSALRLSNGLTHQRTHDTAGRLKSYTLANDVYRLAHDAAGRLITLTPPDPSGQQQFSYDAAGRLTGYQGPAHSESYGYDPNGNRQQRTRDGQSTLYQYLANSNRLQSIDAVALSHDAAGNLALDLTRHYTHDSTGRLTQLTQGATLARYEYNGLGERVLKQIGTELRHFVYGDDGQLLGEYDSAGRPLAEYAWLHDLPLAYRLHRTGNGLARTELYAVEADHLGTPRALTDAAQRLRWRWSSAPFGDTPPDENPEGLGSITFNLRFPGQYYDAESGLHYNTFRDYDPQTGRYIQSDPIGLAGGVNTFAYVGNNPVNWSDPYGLQSTTLPGAGPLIIPPIAKPGSPENTDFVETISNILPNTISVECRGRLCLPTAKGDNGSDDVDGPMEMAKGGKQNIDNEYTREVKNLGSQCQNPCEYLREKYNKETNSNERLKIKAAMKYLVVAHRGEQVKLY